MPTPVMLQIETHAYRRKGASTDATHAPTAKELAEA
jgi:hypothetical protein